MANGKRLAVVIGAGSVKCAAAIGLTHVLAREGIPIDLLVGCSAGSIFAAHTAVGHRSEATARVAESCGRTISPPPATTARCSPR
jgi:NTE family protein